MTIICSLYVVAVVILYMSKITCLNFQTMQKRLISTTLPEVEPSNIVEDLFQKFHDASNNAKIKVVRLPPIDRSNAKSTVAGLQQLGMYCSLFALLISKEMIVNVTRKGIYSFKEND